MRTFFAALLSLIIVIAVSACANNHVEQANMMIGEVDQQHIIRKHKSFKQGYQAFRLSEAEIAEIKSWPSDLHIEVYFGTWCHDSVREVPKFLKMISHSPTLSNRLIALDFKKSEPNGSAKSRDVKYTPTFIVYRDKKEIGRIIERPAVSLTTDISVMLAAKI